MLDHRPGQQPDQSGQPEVHERGADDAPTVEHGPEGTSNEPAGRADQSKPEASAHLLLAQAVERRRNRGRADRGDRHAVGLELVGERAAEVLKVGLGSGVDRDAGGRDTRGHGRDVQDAAATPLFHGHAEQHTYAGDRDDMEIDHGLDARQVLGLELLEKEHARVVYHDVGQHGAPLEEFVGRGGEGEVLEAGRDGQAGVLPSQPRRGLLQLLGTVAHQNQVIPLRRELPGEFETHS